MTKGLIIFIPCIFISVMIFADSSDCNKCEDEFTQCKNHCMVMAADNTHCMDSCVKKYNECKNNCNSDSNNSEDEATDNEFDESYEELF